MKDRYKKALKALRNLFEQNNAPNLKTLKTKLENVEKEIKEKR